MTSRVHIGPLMLATAIALAGCGGASVPGASGSTFVLRGTSWRLVRIGGVPALRQAMPTLAFEETGGASGNAGCNSFGTTSLSAAGGSIDFHNLAMTAVLCADPAIVHQESMFYSVLSSADTATLRDGQLVIAGSMNSLGELVFDRVAGAEPVVQ